MKTLAPMALTAVFMMAAPTQAANIADFQNHPVVPDTKYTNCAREALIAHAPDEHIFQDKINDPEANYDGIAADNGTVYQMIVMGPNGQEAGVDVFTIHGGQQEVAVPWAYKGDETARRIEIQNYMAACIR